MRRKNALSNLANRGWPAGLIGCAFAAFLLPNKYYFDNFQAFKRRFNRSHTDSRGNGEKKPAQNMTSCVIGMLAPRTDPQKRVKARGCVFATGFSMVLFYNGRRQANMSKTEN
ncbi:hypothetical protein T08_5356 [Trichinella sp. T8]|nr:hypothetical protein T08_5356 [Trichinella sp. T8]